MDACAADENLNTARVARSGAPDNALRVAVVSVTWPMETFIDRLLTGLADEGAQITIWSKGAPPDWWLRRRGIQWRYGPENFELLDVARVGRRSGWRPAVRTARQVRTGLARSLVGEPGTSGLGAPDVIYAPWINSLMSHEWLLAGPVPVVTSCRGALISISPWNPAKPGYREDLRWALERSDLVHCVSDAIRGEAQMHGLDPRRARVIRPAVTPPAEVSAHRATAERPLRVLAVGSLIWRKDYEHALLAIAKAVERGTDLCFDIVGSGSDEQHLQFAIDDLGLTKRVRLLGRQSADEVARHLGEADLFLHTSASEGISNAVLEAMAAGLPVVTVDTGGMSEAIRHGVDGILVGVRDADATADALCHLAENQELRAELGRSARERVIEKFQLDSQIDAFMALLREAASR